MKMFPSKKWYRSSIDRLIRKLHETGDIARKSGSGRPRTVRTADNIEAVEELVLSHEDKPHAHLSVREISRQIGVLEASVFCIVHDLSLKCLKRRKAQEVSSANRLAR